MRSYTINLPRGLEVDIFNLPENFDEEINRVFGEYTQETSKDYRDCDRLKAMVNRLAKFEDLEEQGLLVRLQCKVGDILFRINKGARNPIIKMKVSQITMISKLYNIKAIQEDYGEVGGAGK